MKQQAGKQASIHSWCLQVKQQAGKQANIVGASDQFYNSNGKRQFFPRLTI